MTARIAPLAPPLAAVVRSQSVLSSPAQAVAELVANALDAGAREVQLELDLRPRALALAVHDDGTGVRAADMPLLGRRGASSKRPAAAAGAALRPAAAPHAGPTLPPLGYRGEALAALCEAAAEVEVVSHAAGSFETHRAVLTSRGAARCSLAAEQRKRQGTAVAVRGLFSAQPVRQNALETAGCAQRGGREGRKEGRAGGCCNFVRSAVRKPNHRSRCQQHPLLPLIFVNEMQAAA